MPLYDSRTVVVSSGAGFSWQQVFGSNPRRLTISISGSTNAFCKVNNVNGGAANRAYTAVEVFRYAPIAFRDFGTLMQQEVWVATNPAVADLTITEIFRIR